MQTTVSFWNNVTFWDKCLFNFGGIMGAIPFDHREGKLTLTWCSFRSVKYIVITCITHLYLVYYGVRFTQGLFGDGFAASAKYFPWFAAMAMSCGVLLAVLFRHKEMMHHYNSSSINSERGPFAIQWTQDKRKLFLSWVVFFVLLPTAGIMFHVGMSSSHKAYISNTDLAQSFHPDHQPWILAVAIIFHGYASFLSGLTVLVVDLLLLYISVGYQRQFEDINLNLANLVRKSEATQSKITSIHPNETDPNPEPSQSISQVISRELKRHLQVQEELHLFNQTYVPFLMVFVAQVFIMCMVLFFTVMKKTLDDEYDLIIHALLGFKYLCRAFIGLSAFGRVEHAGRATKSLLMKDLGVQYLPQNQYPDELEREIQYFLFTTNDDVCISAGSYIDFSRTYLLSFYGILTTYIAIFMQSI